MAKPYAIHLIFPPNRRADLSVVVTAKPSLHHLQDKQQTTNNNMIQYPYIPPVTGEAAERIAEQADYNAKYRRGEHAPSLESIASARKMFQQAGLFL